MAREQELETMPKGWAMTTLGEVAEINPTESLSKGEIAKCVHMESIAPFTRRISKYESKEFNGGMKFRNGDTLLARITPCLENGKTSFVDILDGDEVGFGSTEYIVIREKKYSSDKLFLYYLSISPRFREIAIKAMTGTSGRQRVQTDLLVNSELLMPTLPEQRAIAAVLSALDDKIELLRKNNKTLENVAQTLFKRWFVDYEFPNEKNEPYKSSGGKMIDSELGEIPAGWRVNSLGDVVDIRGGTTPSTANPDFWGGDIHWTSPKDLSNSRGLFLLDTESKITEAGLSQIGSGLLPRGTLLLSSRAPIGYLAISNIEISINQGYIAFLPGHYFSNHFMYLWLKNNMREIVNAANGSTFLEISKSSFRNIESVVPAKGTLNIFDLLVKPSVEKILSNTLQIQTLYRLRDSLLPKLMKGKLRVKGFCRGE